MAGKFKLGDTVQLKSGGPSMTISSVSEQDPGKYYCIWFKGASRETSNFPEETLKHYESPKKE